LNPNLILMRDGRKFMWDGDVYATREEASSRQEAYQKDNFEVCVEEEEGKFLVYTRRPVKNAAVVAQ